MDLAKRNQVDKGYQAQVALEYLQHWLEKSRQQLHLALLSEHLGRDNAWEIAIQLQALDRFEKNVKSDVFSKDRILKEERHGV